MAENFRPGVLDKLGLGFDAARRIKPDIIYASASGYGADGPYVNRPGQDLLVQALSGLAMVTGTREHGPRAVGVSAIDHHGAALFAGGILAALVRRERTGQGCHVDVSLLSAAIDLQMESFTCYLNGERAKDVRQPGPIAGWYYGAPYGVYATKDGHVAISLGSLDTLGDALGIPVEQRVADSDAFRRREEAAPVIAAHLSTLTTAECVMRLEARSIWHAAVNDYSDVVIDPQIAHNGTFQTVEGATGSPITLVSHPVRYDGEVPAIRLPPQKLGAQSDEILAELGYDAGQVQALREDGAVGTVK
jgi:crotonobetainyl-CoA:carnitine CoA-transferase CaiB-like acyl-CoA transferase